MGARNRWNSSAATPVAPAPDVDCGAGATAKSRWACRRRLRRELQVEPLIICWFNRHPAGTPAYKGRADASPTAVPAGRVVARRSENQPGDIRNVGLPQRSRSGWRAPSRGHPCRPGSSNSYRSSGLQAVTPVAKQPSGHLCQAEPEDAANRVASPPLQPPPAEAFRPNTTRNRPWARSALPLRRHRPEFHRR